MSGFLSISKLNHNSEVSDYDIDLWISNCYAKMNDDFNTPMLIANYLNV